MTSGSIKPHDDLAGYQRIAKPSDLNSYGCECLIRAIVARAAEDYAIGRKAEKKHPEHGPSQLRISAQRFFSGSWFFELTGLDGKWFLQKLDRMVARREENNGRKRGRRRAHETANPH